MRVYQHGVVIPMSDVTWETLGCRWTVVTWEDPEIGWPEEINRKAGEALLSLTEFSRADRWRA